MQLPIFPGTTKLINAQVGFFEKDEFVYYLHNGSPIFCHTKNDLNNIDIRLVLLSHGCVKSNKSFIVFLTTPAFGNN